MINKKFLLAGRPVGRPISDDDFEYKEEEVREINNGEVLLENMVIEFQPAQKGWMENISNYVAPLEIGDVMRCSGIARVLNSKSEKFKKGDIVFWKGHVGICLNSTKFIHAYGPRKKVLIMPINQTIKLIEKTAGLKVKKIFSI